MKTSTKSVMKNAHKIAREAVAKFGGKHSEYFAQALKQAWKIAKALILVVNTGEALNVAWVLSAVLMLFVAAIAILVASGLVVAGTICGLVALYVVGNIIKHGYSSIVYVTKKATFYKGDKTALTFDIK